MDTDPLNAVNLRKLLEKLCKGSATVEVKSVVCRILSDDDKLFDAFFGKILSLLNQLLDRN